MVLFLMYIKSRHNELDKETGDEMIAKKLWTVLIVILISAIALFGCEKKYNTTLDNNSATSHASDSLSQQKEVRKEEIGTPLLLEIPEGKGENILTIANETVLFSIFSLEGEMQSCFYSKNIKTNKEIQLLSLDNLYMFSNKAAVYKQNNIYFVMPDASTYRATGYNEIYEAQNRIVCFNTTQGTGEVVKTYPSGDLLTYPAVLDENRLALNTSVCSKERQESSVSIYAPEDNSLIPVVTKQLYRPDESILWSDFRSSAPPEGMKGEAIHSFAVHEGELYLLVSELSGNEGQKPVYRLEIYSPEGEPVGVIPLDAFGHNSYLNTTILPQAQTMQVSGRHIFSRPSAPRPPF